jgi:sugar phosphate isomerase/epimerase
LFAEALTTYSEAGADGIGIIDRPELWTDGTALDRLRASDLEAGFCIPSTTSILPLLGLGDAYAGSEDPDTRVAEICASVTRLARFEPQFCLCSPGPRGRYEDERAREIVVGGFKRVARAAADVGVTIALEPFHPSIEPTFSFGNSIPEAVELLAEIDEPNTGILFDVWHMWDSDDVLRHIRAHASEFVGIHLDDWRDPTRSWCDRVLPGDGLADLPGILRALGDGGFTGWYELEILSDDGTFGNDFPDSLSKRDPVELIRDGREKFLSAWQASRREL